MALRFGKKKADEAADQVDDAKEVAAFEPQPEKAAKWFAHARAAAETFNYDYALTCYANGIRLDPSLLSAHEAMFDAAVKYNDKAGKPAAGKEIRKIEGPHAVEKFAAAEFAWMKDLNNASLALRFLESSIKARQWAGEVGRWHCPRILNILRRQKKQSKSMYLSAKELFPELGAWDEAIAAGEEALRIDPKDASLENELKDLAAQRAMDQGRYEEAAGEAGGFRKFVKDMDRQRELEESESLDRGLDAEQRALSRAREEYESTPGVPDSINKYGQLLKAVGTAEAQEQAYAVFMKGYEETGQYRFRAAAGDIRIEQAQSRVAALREKAEGGDAEAEQELAEARAALHDIRYRELRERVKEYPTDRRLKQQLGEVEFDLGKYEEAMQCFQESKDDPKLRVRSGYMLGRSFAAEGWHDIAIQEYKEALDRIEAGERVTELAIRYDLMVSLMEHARTEGSLDLAREALEICSSIARKNITYRDIRARRKQADELIKELSGPASDG